MFRLESAEKIEGKGRYTFLGTHFYGEIIGYENETIVRIHGKEERDTRPFLEVVKQYVPSIEQTDDVPFVGGAVGYIGYDSIRQIEQIGKSLSNPMPMPDSHVFLYDDIYVYDHLLEKGYRYKNYRQTEEVSIDFFQLENVGDFETSFVESNIEKERFIKNVEKVKEHLACGDIFQLVLSQRFQTSFQGDSLGLYKKLRNSNPSPYMYYLNFLKYQIVGTSPESLVSVHQNRVKTNPIAGTKPRGKTRQEDQELEELLKEDEKELAEHYMLVDLGRNDLGKVCEVGSVHVNRFVEVERYRRVMHLVSEVTGELREGLSMVDVLQSCLPAGTVSGAPKIRAMQIINELEGERRGVYGGAVGYISANGNMDMALTIRTIVLCEEKAYVQAGAGIVLDSIPKMEYEETIHKASALLEVLTNDFVNR